MKFIKLTQGKKAIVDDEDFVRLSNYKWSFDKYGFRHIFIFNKNKKWYLHWEIIGYPNKGYQIDHINGDKLDNRKKNLRIVTIQQNIINKGIQSNNTSGYKGVSWSKKYNKWIAQIGFNYKKIYLGTFETKELAYKAYCDACKKYHKQFANF